MLLEQNKIKKFWAHITLGRSGIVNKILWSNQIVYDWYYVTLGKTFTIDSYDRYCCKKDPNEKKLILKHDLKKLQSYFFWDFFPVDIIGCHTIFYISTFHISI